MKRRIFLGSGLAATVVSGAFSRLNLGAVGIGGVARSYLAGVETENIAALCDVDDALGAPMYAKYPAAKRYRDWRAMLDKERSLDGIVIATPDHSHAAIALAALDLGKHVYCAKPLTRTIAEARALAAKAKDKQVATQMSVQSCGSDASVTTAEWIRAGAVGDVSDVHIWTDRPVWPQGLERPLDTTPVPETLDWRLWLADAPPRPFHQIYHPFNWRGWVDFGTGALGDMGCHAFHVAVRALDLPLPEAARASTSFHFVPATAAEADPKWARGRRLKPRETFPSSSVVTWSFPGRRLRMHWYDGGLQPARPAAVPLATTLPASGMLFCGDKGALLTGFTGGAHQRFGSDPAWTPPAPHLARSKGHYQEWIAAAKGGASPLCDFQFGSRLTEICLMGVEAQLQVH